MTERETPITARCKAWRNILPVNPACEIIPAYDDSKLIELGRDLKASGGMKIPVIVLVQPDDIALLDGRSRLDALCHVGIKFEIKVIDGHVVIEAPGYDIPAPIEIVPDANFNAYAFVLSTNLHRRHLKNTDKRAITKKVLVAQPALSDRAVAQMVGFGHKTVKAIRQEAYGEIPHKDDRVEASGRKARGRKPGQTAAAPAKPVETTAPAKSVDIVESTEMAPVLPTVDKPAVAPLATSTKTKRVVAPNGFDVEEALAIARRVFAILNRQVSGPNNDDARNETRRLINLLLAHKTPKPSTAGVPARAA